MRNHCFSVSRDKVVHHFSKHFSRGVLESAFYRFLIEFWSFWAYIWRPLPPLLRVTFSGHKKVKIFFWPCSWAEAILDTAGRRGELGGIWAKGGPEEDLKEIVPKHMCFSVESGASDRFACTRATWPSPSPQPVHKSWRATGTGELPKHSWISLPSRQNPSVYHCLGKYLDKRAR